MTPTRQRRDGADRLQQQLELATMATDTGLVGGAGLPAGSPWIPVKTWLEDGKLYWQHFDGSQPKEWPRIVTPEGALDAFIRLRHQDDVLRFAQRWGPLMLCRHQLPHTHTASSEKPAGCQPSQAEPIAAWLHLAQRARALLQAAAAMRQGKRAPIEAWEFLYSGRRQPGGEFPPEIKELFANLSRDHQLAAKLAWLHLKPLVDRWVLWANLRPQVAWGWDPREPSGEIRMAGDGTFGVLATQLLAAITGARGVFFCDACGQPYSPQRKPQAGRRRFCASPDCKRKGAALRKRTERESAKKR